MLVFIFLFFAYIDVKIFWMKIKLPLKGAMGLNGYRDRNKFSPYY